MKHFSPIDVPTLNDWCLRNPVQRLTVISPHLDDAGFSLAATISSAPVPAHVYTVFTEADEQSDMAWAQATGFSNAFEEFARRKKEDLAAMQALGVPFSHGGIAFCRMTERSAGEMSKNVLKLVEGPSSLILLPLGAGGYLRGYKKVVWRLFRRPFGAPVHGDHVWVRDVLRAALTGRSGCKIGYYAEIPYQLSNSAQELSALAVELIRGPVNRVIRKPDADFKLAVAECYQSQILHILSEKRAHRRRVCAVPEILFLPQS